MSEEQLICAREGCEKTVKRKTHNQKYCSDDCCRLATNRRIMVNYYEEKDRLSGKSRYCNVCDGPLSRYNNSLVCNSCRAKRELDANESVADMLRNASIVI